MAQESTSEALISDPSNVQENGDSSRGALPFDSLEALAAAHTELLRREISAETADQPEFHDDVREMILRGRLTGSRLESPAERRTAQSLLNYWVTVMYRCGDIEPPDAVLVPFVQPKKLDLTTARCPYIGLTPFTEVDRDRFYGRYGVTGRLIKRLAENRLVVLVGPPGSGKTSVVNAGVIPALKSGNIVPGSERWHYFPAIAPGREPLAQLAAMLATDSHPAPSVESFSDPTALSRLLGERFPEQRALIVVDRFEELFTLCKDDKQRDTFIANIINLRESNETPAQHGVILITRSDRTHYLIQRTDLKALYPTAEVRIHPLRESDLREAIKEPARKIGLKFERGVTAQLIREIYGDPSGLPLLQFALLRMWDEKQGDTITWAAMNRMVNCAYGLVQTAEAWFKSLNVEQQSMARLMLLKMVRITENLDIVGDRVSREDLYHKDYSREAVDQVIASLVKARLVRVTPGQPPALSHDTSASSGTTTPSPDDQFQLVHEALWRYWETFTEWLKNLREAFVRRQRFESLACNWVGQGRQEAGLLDKYQLHEAKSWLNSPQAAELGYDVDLALLVKRSDEAVTKDRRFKIWSRGILIAIGVLALVGAVIIAVTVQRRLRQATSRRLAEKAKDLRRSQLDLALLLSLEAYTKDPNNPEARNSLMRSLAYSPRLRGFLQMPTKAKQVAFSPQGDRLSAISINGQTSSWNVKTLQAVYDRPGGNSEKEKQAEYFLTADGDHSVAVDGNKLTVNSLKAGGSSYVVPTSDHESDELEAWTLSPDGRHLAWVTLSAPDSDSKSAFQLEMTLWDITEQKKLRTVLVNEQPLDLMFSPDGSMLATVTLESNILLHQVSDLKETGRISHRETPLQGIFVFSGDGKWLAACDEAGRIIVWNVNDRTRVGSFSLPGDGEGPASSPGADWMRSNDQLNGPSTFALSFSGKELVAGYEDGTVVFWNVANHLTPEDTFPKQHVGQVTNIVFTSRDDTAVITTSSGGNSESILLWNAQQPSEDSETESDSTTKWEATEIPTGRVGAIRDVAVSSDYHNLSVVANDGSIIVFDLQDERTGTLIQPPGGGEILAQTFAREGANLIARNQSDQISVYDVSTGKQINTFSITANGGQVADAVFSKDGRSLAVRTLDNTIRIWEPFSGKVRVVVSPEAMRMPAGKGRIAIGWDGTKLAWTHDAGIVFWDAASGKIISEPKQEKIVCVAFNRDATQAISGTVDGRVRVWDVASGKQLLEPTTSHISGTSSVGFTPDGSKLLSVSEDGTLYIWNAQGEPIVEHPANVASFVITHDDQTLACVRKDGRVLFWDLVAEEEIGTFGFGNNSPVVNVAHSLERGDTLAAGHSDGSILLVKLGIDALRDRACRVANRDLRPIEVSFYRVFEDQAWRFWKRSDSFRSEVCSAGPANVSASEK